MPEGKGGRHCEAELYALHACDCRQYTFRSRGRNKYGMDMYDSRVDATRVENVSREVEENGREGKKAHATTAVWAGFHNKNIWRRKAKAASS